MASALKRVGVAICGAGVVGGGVIEILRKQASALAARGLQFDIHMVSPPTRTRTPPLD